MYEISLDIKKYLNFKGQNPMIPEHDTSLCCDVLLWFSSLVMLYTCWVSDYWMGAVCVYGDVLAHKANHCTKGNERLRSLTALYSVTPFWNNMKHNSLIGFMGVS